MKNLLKNYLNKHKNSKIQIINFKNLLYTKFDEVHHDEELLFERALNEFGINAAFDYAMTWSVAKNTTHVFLCKYQELRLEYDFAFAQHLLFRNFYQQNSSSYFALLALDIHSSFIYFFKQDELLLCKHIPKLNILFLKNQDKKEFLKLFEHILFDQMRLKSLCKDYGVQEIYVLDDDFYLSEFLENALFIPSKKLNLKDLNQILIKLELQRQDKQANFLRRMKKEKGFKKYIFTFFFAFFCAFCFNTYQNYQIPTLKSTNADSFLVDEKQKTEFELYQNVFYEFEEEYKNYENSLFYILEKLFEVLNENSIKLKELELQYKNFKILTDSDEKQLKNLYDNPFFIIKNKEKNGNLNEIHLEFKNE